MQSVIEELQEGLKSCEMDGEGNGDHAQQLKKAIAILNGDDKLAEIQTLVDSLSPKLVEESDLLDEEVGEDGEDFNPMDWSGGNFDDAYYMGTEHGEMYGKLEILNKIDFILRKED